MKEDVKPIDIKSLLRSAGSSSLSEILQQKGLKLSDLLKGGQNLPSIKPATTTTTTSTPTTTTSPADIKSLLRSVGSSSLSEILQQKGLKLADLLKGGQNLPSTKPTTTTTTTASPLDIKELLRNAGTLSLSEILQQKGLKLSDVLKGGQTNARTTSTTKAPAQKPVPSAIPISVKELLASSNISLKDIATNPSSISSSTPSSTTSRILLDPNQSMPAGVKRPRPFVAGRTKSFTLRPSTTTTPSTVDVAEDVAYRSRTPVPKVYKDTSHLKPLLFGDLEHKLVSTTTTTTRSPRRPYVVGNSVGEYGAHIIVDDDEDGPKAASSNIVTYGNRRPIATSRFVFIYYLTY